MDAQKFGAFVQLRRKELGMNQAELAEKLHVTAKAVSRWERGVGFPDIKLLEPLADALEITIVELMHSRKIETDLPKETAAEMVSQTVSSIQKQGALSQKRKLLLFFGTLLILVAECFLIWVSYEIVREPRWVSSLIYWIGFFGGVYGIRALKTIITQTYQEERVKVRFTWKTWLACIMILGGILLLFAAALLLKRGDGLRDFCVVSGLMITFFGCLFYSVVIHEDNPGL